MRIVLALSLFAAACGGDGDGEEKPYNCATEDRDDEFVAGLQKVGVAGKLTFTLLEATPAPPARDDNTWILQLTAKDTAAPVTGADLIVTPFMPDHAHGTPTTVEIEPMPTEGTYKLSPVNMWMPGLWQTTIQVEGADGDKAVFAFCIPT